MGIDKAIGLTWATVSKVLIPAASAPMDFVAGYIGHDWRRNVEARKRHIKNYVSRRGRDCFHDWIRSVRDRQTRQIFRIRLNRVMQGNLGDCRPVGDGVLELRIDFGPGYRIYFGEDADDVILLGGGEKSTQPVDIETAKQRWREYNA